jgi:hypothetical protein
MFLFYSRVNYSGLNLWKFDHGLRNFQLDFSPDIILSIVFYKIVKGSLVKNLIEGIVTLVKV